MVPLFAATEKVEATFDQPAKSTTVVTGAPAASQLVRVSRTKLPLVTTAPGSRRASMVLTRPASWLSAVTRNAA